MKNVSEVSIDEIVQDLVNSELGYVLLKEDKENTMFDVLARKTTYKDRQGLFGDRKHIGYHLFPVRYRISAMDADEMKGEKAAYLVNVRSNAIHNIFMRWTEAGYNTRHAKKPYACKAFVKYLDEIEFTKADFVLLLVE